MFFLCEDIPTVIPIISFLNEDIEQTFFLSSKQCPKYRKRSESQVAGSLASWVFKFNNNYVLDKKHNILHFDWQQPNSAAEISTSYLFFYWLRCCFSCCCFLLLLLFLLLLVPFSRWSSPSTNSLMPHSLMTHTERERERDIKNVLQRRAREAGQGC